MIGLALALAYTGRAALAAAAVVTAYVEFIRNVPLILLVYLVFYGIPSAGGFAYGADQSFIMTLSVYAGAYLVEVFRAGLDAVPRGLIDAGKAIGLTPLAAPAPRPAADHVPRGAAVAQQHLRLAVQGHLGRVSVIAVPELTYGAQWIKFNTFRVVEVYAVVTPMYLVTGYAHPARCCGGSSGASRSALSMEPRAPVAAVPVAGPRRHPSGLGPGRPPVAGRRASSWASPSRLRPAAGSTG